MTYARCRTCHGLIHITTNRCARCGRLHNIWNAAIAWARRKGLL